MELEEIRQKMTKALEILADELAVLKTGRANPALVEKIMVEAYERRMPLVELATITTPAADQLMITPFDQAIAKNIERALSLERNLGLSVIVDENVVRVNIPPLTEERRQEFIKILRGKLEAGRVMIRQIRHDKMMELKRAFEVHQISEDERFRQEQELQKLTEEFNERIEGMGKAKEEELLTI
jgi:ribosome recycling factor